jgi:hypothetical protein
MGSGELMVNQMCVTTPAPVTSSSVAVWPGSTGTESLLPPVLSQLEERRVLYERRRDSARSSSGTAISGGAVAASLADAGAAFRPSSADAETPAADTPATEAMAPSSLRRDANAESGLVACIGNSFCDGKAEGVF